MPSIGEIMRLREGAEMDVTKQKDQRVATQDNQLIESCYTMTLNEKRLLLLGISKIDPRQLPKRNDPFVFSVTADEWAAYYPDQDNPYRALKRASKALRGRFVRLHPRTGITEEINWIDSIRYHEKQGRVDVRFSWSIQLRLAGMLEQFTKVDLLAVSKLNSLHSVRLYELVAQFRSTGFRVISVEDFRFAMDCEKSYPLIKDLKRWVLLPAINEINTKSDICVGFDELKKGRRITAFRFSVAKVNQIDMFTAK
jgi:plasmid replication initiation protein